MFKIYGNTRITYALKINLQTTPKCSKSIRMIFMRQTVLIKKVAYTQNYLIEKNYFQERTTNIYSGKYKENYTTTFHLTLHSFVISFKVKFLLNQQGWIIILLELKVLLKA